MITQGDDYPIHQTPEPVQQVFTSDRNFYDRFFFNGYFREGEPYFAAAMGIYPNIGMIDCAFSVIVGGVQHCVRASRVLGIERLDTRVGPIAIEIVRPMRTLRVRVNHEAVQADLVFEARVSRILGSQSLFQQTANTLRHVRRHRRLKLERWVERYELLGGFESVARIEILVPAGA